MYSCKDGWIIDEAGRRLILRGVNLGGSSKMPLKPNGASYLKEGFYDYKDVSFVGRPFPLAQADEHFERLSSWGLRFLRFIVTWEAVEHAGPGIYDQDYLNYLRQIIEKAGHYGIGIYIDPHQDVWSRWTGGDGAPAWTLELLGFELKNLHASGAAIVHQESEPYPRMVWATNYNRLACASLFSLFYGGNRFAPGILMEGEPVQDFLQSSFTQAMVKVAHALAGLENVVGFGSMNEPTLGFIGCSDISKLERAMMRRGPMPSPYQAMLAGSGYSQRVDNWHLGISGNYRLGKAHLNPSRLSAWQEGKECIWKRLGVWDDAGGKPRLLRPDYFSAPGNLGDAFLKPFMLSFLKEIRAVEKKHLFFIEGVPNADHPSWGLTDPPNAVNASHWYDGLSLVTKRYQEFINADNRTFKPGFGPAGVRRVFRNAVSYWKNHVGGAMGGIPTLIGEFGLQFDINGGRAYLDGNFSVHERALDAYYQAMDANLLSATLWNYTADNLNQGGDHWNDEDLSIYSRDQGGARALKGFCRPYPLKTAGSPLRLSFIPRGARFEFSYLADPEITEPSEIYIPPCHYPQGQDIRIEGPEGSRAEFDAKNCIMRIYHPKAYAGVIGIRIFPVKSKKERG